jgi:hypothetical protein
MVGLLSTSIVFGALLTTAAAVVYPHARPTHVVAHARRHTPIVAADPLRFEGAATPQYITEPPFRDISARLLRRSVSLLRSVSEQVLPEKGQREDTRAFRGAGGWEGRRHRREGGHESHGARLLRRVHDGTECASDGSNAAAVHVLISRPPGQVRVGGDGPKTDNPPGRIMNGVKGEDAVRELLDAPRP